jgi:hypothetical protein
MSIAPIGATGAHIPPAAVQKPESAELPGAVEHDGDSDDGAATSAPAAAPGRVDVKG